MKRLAVLSLFLALLPALAAAQGNWQNEIKASMGLAPAGTAALPYFTLPRLSTAQLPSTGAAAGFLFDRTLLKPRFWDDTSWKTVASEEWVAASGTAANATNVTVAASTVDAAFYPTFVSDTTGNLPVKVGTGLTFNPYTSWWSISGGVSTLAFTGAFALSDVVVPNTIFKGQNAYPQAVTNTTGGNLYFASGIGQRKLTISDYTTLVDKALSMVVDQSLPTTVTYTLTEGIEFSAQTSNAVTAANLSAAINAWCPGITAEVVSATVYLTPTPYTKTLALGGDSGFGQSSGADGTSYFTGEEYHFGQLNFRGNANFDSEWIFGIFPGSKNPGVAELVLPPGALITYSCSLPATFDAIDTYDTLQEGRMVMIKFLDANSTLSTSAFTPAPGMGSFVSKAGSALCLYYDGSAWQELWRTPSVSPLKSGTATINGTTGVTVSTTAVKATSIIVVSYNTPKGGVTGILSAPVASIVADTSFVIMSTDAGDTTSTVNWAIVN